MNLKILLIFLCTLLFFSSFLNIFLFSQGEFAKVIKIIDGDTILTDKGKVRLAGINAPEKGEKYYNDSLNFLNSLIGKEVYMIKNKENKDKYGRLLRYVYYKKNLINEELLRKGLAHLYYYKYDSNYKRLKEAEEKAREEERGIWKKSEEKCSKCIKLSELNKNDPNEYVILENICDFSCDLNGWKIEDDANHIFILNLTLFPKKQEKIIFKERIWNDDKDSFFLFDKEEKLVIWYRYGYK